MLTNKCRTVVVLDILNKNTLIALIIVNDGIHRAHYAAYEHVMVRLNEARESYS